MGINEMLVAALGIIGIFFVPFIVGGSILFYLLKARNKERMELIRQGIIPSQQMKATPNKLIALRNGCLAIGLAIGIIVGMIVDYNVEYSDMGSFLIMLSSSILFLGLGYIAFYLLVRNRDTDEE